MIPSMRSSHCFALVLALLSVTARVADAQGRDKGVFCSAHGNVGACDGTAECDRLWAEHVRQYHRGDGSGLDNVVAANLSPMGTPMNVTARSLVFGGFMGALGGSLMMVNDSTSHALAGAYGLAGLGLMSGVIANRGAWGPISSVVLGAAGGAGLGASVGKFGEKSDKGTPARVEEEKKTSSAMIAGATAGAAVGFTLSLISKQTQWPVGRWFGPQGRARLINGPRRLGVGIAW